MLYVVLPITLVLVFGGLQSVAEGPLSLGHKDKKKESTATTASTVPVVTSSPEPASTIQPPVSSPPTDHSVKNGYAAVPRRDLTPGAIDGRVTQENIHDTICTDGWVDANMPPPSYMTPTKTKQIAAYGYTTYAIDDFDLDHLVPLELGGDPTALANLWPQPWESQQAKLVPRGWGAETKDRLEARLHDAVCAGRMSLTDARTAIAGDWIVVANQAGIPAGEQAG